MKFLIDAQLPRRLATELKQAGFQATHTLELPDGKSFVHFALLCGSMSLKEKVNRV